MKGPIAITTAADDYYKSEKASAALPNSAWMLLLHADAPATSNLEPHTNKQNAS